MMGTNTRVFLDRIDRIIRIKREINSKGRYSSTEKYLIIALRAGRGMTRDGVIFKTEMENGCEQGNKPPITLIIDLRLISASLWNYSDCSKPGLG